LVLEAIVVVRSEVIEEGIVVILVSGERYAVEMRRREKNSKRISSRRM
jgi:hypothetical protein